MFLTALIEVDLTGLKHVTCKMLLTQLVFFHKHCSLGYFCCHKLSRLSYQLIVVNTTIYYSGFPTLVVLCRLCTQQ